MSSFEAADSVQPRRQSRRYRSENRKAVGYMWVVLVLFSLVAFLCVNNFMVLQSYLELKDQLTAAYKTIETAKNDSLDLSESKKKLESLYSSMMEENRQLKENYEKMSRGSIDVSKQMEELKKQNNELMNKNKQLTDDNIALQNSLKLAASVGVKPQNYSMFEKLDPRYEISRGKYIGKFLGTAYTPSKEECGNDKGITNSGLPIVPGVTLAVDSRYWPFGTVFYIKGLGYTVAMDTGSAVKGKYRFDFSVLDKKFARQLGARKWEVFLVKMGKGSVDSSIKL